MLAEQSKNDELIADQLRFAIQARGEPAMNGDSAKPELPHEIKIDESHRVLNRVLNSPPSSGGYTFYVALIVGLLATTSGVGWFILYQSALPFGLTSVSGLTGNHDLGPKAISFGLEQSPNSPAARTPDTQNSDHIQIHDAMVREIARSAPAEAPQKSNVSSASTRSVTTAPLSRLASKDTAIALRPTAGAKVNEARTPTKLTPTPETRPTTIEGWTLREVVNGTAVIEGPNGIWKVTPGQTVPGIGRLDSIVRWGNRLVVVTSRGLISTP